MTDFTPRSRPLRPLSLDLAGLQGFVVAEAPDETRTDLRTGGGWRFVVGVIIAGYLVTIGVIGLVNLVAYLRGF